MAKCEKDCTVKWEAKATGDMTLSVVDETGFQVMKIDMLEHNTMQAGTEGLVLLQAYNDLALIAGFSEKHYNTDPESRMYPDGSISELPLYCKYIPEKRRLIIGNQKSKIAERVFLKRVSEETITEIIEIIQAGIAEINKTEKTANGSCI